MPQAQLVRMGRLIELLCLFLLFGQSEFPIGLEKLDQQHQADQGWDLGEVEVMPGTEADGLAENRGAESLNLAPC